MLFENMPSNLNKSKDSVFKPTKLDIKNFNDKASFEKQKQEFLRRKTRRYKPKKEDANLPTGIKNLIGKYGDIMVNICAKDMMKYNMSKSFKKQIHTLKIC